MRARALGLGLLVLATVLSLLVWLGGDAAPALPGGRADDAGPAASGAAPAAPSVPRPQRASPQPLHADEAPFAHEAEPARTAQEDAALPAARLVGRVVDEAGRALAGAEVFGVPTSKTLYDTGRFTAADARLDVDAMVLTVTGEDGRFALDLPHTGAHRFLGLLRWPEVPEVVVRAHGFALVAVACPAFRGEAYDVGDVVLARGGACRGRVVDETGRPLPGTAVAVLVRNLRDASGAGVAQTLEVFLRTGSGADGGFRVDGLPPCDVGVSVRREGFVPHVEYGHPLGPGEELDLGELVLARGATLHGLVLDEQGTPLPGTTVLASPDDMATRVEGFDGDTLHLQWSLAQREALATAITDGAGRFALAGLGPGQVALYASGPGRAIAKQARASTGGEQPIVLELPPAARLLVSVRDATSGAPVAEARVTVHGAVRFANLPALPVTGPGGQGPEGVLGEGEHLVTGISASQNEVRVEAPGYATQEWAVAGAAPGQLVRFTAELQAGATLSGRLVSPEGEPLGDVPLAVAREVEDEARPRSHNHEPGVSGRDGRFAVGGLLPGAWRVLVGFDESAPGLRPVFGEPVRVPPGGQVDVGDIVVERAAIVDGVLLDADGAPVPAATVTAYSLSGVRPFVAGGQVDSEAVTDRQGRFRFPTLAAGSWELAAEPGARVRLELARGDEQQVVLRCRRPPRLVGRVTSGGLPLAGVTVRAVEEAARDALWGAELTRRTTHSDESGAYALALQATGAHSVSLAVPGGPRLTREIDGAWDETIVLDHDVGSSRLDGLVLAADDGRPLPGARLSIRGEPDDGGPPVLARAVAGEDGRFQACCLAAGAYTVSASAPGHATTSSEPLQLPAAEARTVELRLPVGAELVVHLPARGGEGVVVRALAADGRVLGQLATQTSPARLTGLPPGPCTLEVRRDGPATGPLLLMPLHLQPGEQEIEVPAPDA